MDSSNMKIKIDGMSCNHCKMTVEKILSKIEAVKSFEVNLEQGEAVIIGNTDPKLVIEEINKAGYRATLAE